MTAALANRPNIPYGARQFQQYIEKSTYRAFFMALSVLTLAILAFAGLNAVNQTVIQNYTPPVITEIEDIVLPKMAGSTAPATGTNSPAPAAPAIEIPSIANYKPVPIDIPVEPLTFEPTTPIGSPNAVNSNNPGTTPGGSGEPSQNNNPGGTQSGSNTLPGAWDFDPVEVEPVMDQALLKKNLVYPELAKRAGIEGKVIIRVLVGKNGRAMETMVLQSRHDALSKAAVEAIMVTQFSPAQQNGVAVPCWLSIPVDFSLR